MKPSFLARNISNLTRGEFTPGTIQESLTCYVNSMTNKLREEKDEKIQTLKDLFIQEVTGNVKQEKIIELENNISLLQEIRKNQASMIVKLKKEILQKDFRIALYKSSFKVPLICTTVKELNEEKIIELEKKNSTQEKLIEIQRKQLLEFHLKDLGELLTKLLIRRR